MLDGGQIIVVSGLLIGLVYGAVGLLSGFCLMSSLRGWWADGDGRLVRVMDDWSPSFDGFYLYYPSRRQMRPALRAFADFFRIGG